MQSNPGLFQRQPSAIIGIIVSCILAVLSILTGEGVIGQAAAGQVTDGVNAIAQLAVILAPLVTGLLIRTQVTPVAAPKLPLGTPVLVLGTGDTPPPDAAVLPVSPQL